MIAEFLVVAFVPGLLIAAAGWDVASYTIPNAIPLALVVGFAVFVIVQGMPPEAIGSHVLAGFAGLVVGFTLFALGYIGGGDAKLFAGIVLWLGFRNFAEYALVAAVAGGALTLAVISLRRMPLPAALGSKAWIARLHDRGSGVPYGVALAAGAFLILPHTEIFRLATG